MSGIIYGDGQLLVTLDEDGVLFECDGEEVRVSRGAMREIVSGYHRELDQERERRREE